MSAPTTPNLSLPLIASAQAQKHVTHNDALAALDALVQISVADRDTATPPPSVAEGARYIVAAGAEGVWSGHDGELAVQEDGGWRFFAPQAGWTAESLAGFEAGPLPGKVRSFLVSLRSVAERRRAAG